MTLSNALAAESEWLVRNWQSEDGLPDNTVTAIQQTHDGYLWVGTPKGLARFDGVHFRVFNAQQFPALMDGRISALLADPHGILWIGTQSGHLLRYENGRFQPIILNGQSGSKPADGAGQDGSGKVVTSTLVEDATGGIWWLMPDDSGLLHYQGGQMNLYSSTNGLPPGGLGDLCADTVGQIWLVAGNELYCWRDGKWVDSENAKSPGNDLSLLVAARTGGLWAKDGELIRRFEAGKWREQLEPTPSLPNSTRLRMTAMLEDHSGRVWLGLLWDGIWFSEAGGPWQRLPNQGSLADCEIQCLYEDRQGAIWVGSNREGLHCIRLRPVTMLKPPAPTQESIILTSCAGRDGSVWVGTGDAGAFRYTDGRVEAFGSEQGLGNLHVNSIFEDSHTNLWFGTAGGLFQFEQGRFKRVTGLEELSESVLALFEDRAGRLWAGGAGGLVCRQDGVWSTHPLLAGNPYLDIRALADDSAGNLWVGTVGSGLFRVRGDQVTQFRQSGGFTSVDACSLCCDATGVLWIGTIGSGLFRLENGQFTAYTTADGLPCDVIAGISLDADGNLWFGSDNGIFACSPATFKKYQRGHSPALLCVHLLVADGLGSRACSGGGQPRQSRSADGRLWFPDMRGLAVFDPRTVEVQPAPPKVLVESVVVDGKEFSPVVGGGLRVSSSARRFEINYTAPVLLAPQSVRFRYQLEGMDREWVDARNQRTAYYSQLPFGKFQFRVMAGGADGKWHEAVPLVLQVVPRIWERRWVQVLAGMLLVGVIAASLRSAERRRHQRRIVQLEQIHALEVERSRIARDIHDDLGASLTQIAMLSELARDNHDQPNQTCGQLEEIFTVARRVVRSVDEIVWAVNPKNDPVESSLGYILKSAEDQMRSAGLPCRFDLPEVMPARVLSSSVRHNLYLAVREALNNIVKHATATEVRVCLSVVGDFITLEIADNGRGFVVPALPLAVAKSEHDGLANLVQRMKTIGGRCELTSQPGQGTVVRFSAPLLPEAAAK